MTRQDLAPDRGRRRVYLGAVAMAVIAAYTAFVLVNTQIVGHQTRVPFLPDLYLQDALDILAAAALVLLAILTLDRLLDRDQRRLVATLDGLARVTSLARRIGGTGASHTAAEFRQQVRPIEESSHAQVSDLAATFGQMLTRLEEAVETQRRFLADTSHELRNPLTSLSMNLTLLQREDIAEDVKKEAADEAAAEAARMQRLVKDLLLLARGDTAEVLNLEVVDLDGLVTEVAGDAATAGSAPVVLDAIEPAQVIADPDRIRQVLLNLLENAQRFTPPSGRVTLSVRRVPRAAVISCADTGAGISPEHVPYVFERFYQADPARSGGGAGLGLAIVKHLVEAHGGRVNLTSAVGAGTTVTFTLPLAAAEA